MIPYNGAMTDMTHSYHYGVMRRALEILDGAQTQISLQEIADQMGMSPAHFQRTFSKWVGVSPKRYQQYLALGYAKSLLSDRFTTLATADAVGLSGSSRLHDMFLTWEVMSPGEFAAKGKGIAIHWDWAEGPFGDMIIAATDRGICGVGFSDEFGRDWARDDMQARWPEAAFIQNPEKIAPHAQQIVEGTEARLHLIGAPFQIKVWEALLRIPTGNVSTYSEIASSIGHPRAVRAVGTAVGRNPVSWLIPCHRALRKSGGLGGYHWGLPVKRALLAWESARSEANVS